MKPYTQVNPRGGCFGNIVNKQNDAHICSLGLLVDCKKYIVNTKHIIVFMHVYRSLIFAIIIFKDLHDFCSWLERKYGIVDKSLNVKIPAV